MSKNEISYEQALETLRIMFPDTDFNLVAMLLKQNGGHMEKTIDALVSLSEAGGEVKPGSNNFDDRKVGVGEGIALPKPSSSSTPKSKNVEGAGFKRPFQNVNDNLPALPSEPPPPPSYPRGIRRPGPSPLSRAKSDGHVNSPAEFNFLADLPDDFLRPPSFYKNWLPEGNPDMIINEETKRLALDYRSQSSIELVDNAENKQKEHYDRKRQLQARAQNKSDRNKKYKDIIDDDEEEGSFEEENPYLQAKSKTKQQSSRKSNYGEFEQL